MHKEVWEQYNLWREEKTMPSDLKILLNEMKESPEEIRDSFYRDLEFGTGGLRGLLGAGTNRMNLYTVGKAAQGLAEHLKKSVSGPASVAIAYDSRIKSEEFARYAAGVLAANEIRVWIYPRLQPTPALSWAVRELKCDGGICITASHNPASYNGFKVYGGDGCQIRPEEVREIQAEMDCVDLFRDVGFMDFDEGIRQKRIRMIPGYILNDYIERSCREGETEPSCARLRIVYTPLNGAGRECVMRALEKLGGIEVRVVPEQEMPDGNFPTCPCPNPENHQALEKGLFLCRKLHPDLLLATDPDCDRVGAAAIEGNEWKLLTGNETGILLLNYLCLLRGKKHGGPKADVAVTTIVSTDMADAVCKKYGVELRRTLTGFKYIGEQIGRLEEAGEAGRYLFGFEESCGCLSGTHVRDKDGVNAVVLICRMAAYYKERGLTLWDAMKALYEEFGWYQNELLSFNFDGADGTQVMERIMRLLRTAGPEQIGGMKVASITDYQVGVGNLPKADVLEFRLENGGKLIIRPSGTEPKMKVYCFVRQDSREGALDAMKNLTGSASGLLLRYQKGAV
ncbi:phospho-sugar mutase [Clostridium sp. MCC353]|uniref:phospho-sugar mutase n=1 Tax=Clostridium sp. MCC353 TaxID=2592646 RepID=UPI001C00EB6B|nr:phospho-sugar mutase [Clostridium sp. MCC353]MBT9777028.1 phospho-sugar mutase [Clostridium sp. MCC353]